MLICTSALVCDSFFSIDTSMISFANAEHRSLANTCSLWVISCIWSSGAETTSSMSLELLLPGKTLSSCKWKGLVVFYFLVSFGVLFWWFVFCGFFVCLLGFVLVLFRHISDYFKAELPENLAHSWWLVREGTVRRLAISGQFGCAGAVTILVLMWWFEYQLHARQLGAPCHCRISELPYFSVQLGGELPGHGCHRCDRGVTKSLGAFWWVLTEQG